MAKELLDNFFDHDLVHIKRCRNVEANELAQMALGYRITGALAKVISLEIKMLPPIEERNIVVEVNTIIEQGEWRKPYADYLIDLVLQDKPLIGKPSNTYW